MRKNLNLKLSWYTPENWEKLIESGYLPILAIETPDRFRGTPIHFPKLAPKRLGTTEYKDYLEEKIKPWKILNSMDVLSHVSCAPKGVVILTSTKDDPYRKILGEYLESYLESEVSEYEYN